jgi:hypothetical protein
LGGAISFGEVGNLKKYQKEVRRKERVLFGTPNRSSFYPAGASFYDSFKFFKNAPYFLDTGPMTGYN